MAAALAATKTSKATTKESPIASCIRPSGQIGIAKLCQSSFDLKKEREREGGKERFDFARLVFVALVLQQWEIVSCRD